MTTTVMESFWAGVICAGFIGISSLIGVFYTIIIYSLITHYGDPCTTHISIYIIISLVSPIIYGCARWFSNNIIYTELYVCVNYALCVTGLILYFTIPHCTHMNILYSYAIILCSMHFAIFIISLTWVMQLAHSIDS